MAETRIPYGRLLNTVAANNDGVTSAQTRVAAAVAAAYAAGAVLYWPEGTYLTTANIPNFRDVRHIGPGIVKRGSDLFYITPRAGQTNNLYCSSSGSSSNDGLSASEPIDGTLQSAVDFAEAMSPKVGDAWTINVAGTGCKKFTVDRGIGTGLLTIQGPGSPGDWPTAGLAPQADYDALITVNCGTVAARNLFLDGTAFIAYATSVDGAAAELTLYGVLSTNVLRGITNNNGSRAKWDIHTHFLGNRDDASIGYTSIFCGLRSAIDTGAAIPSQRAYTFTAVANGTSYAVTKKRIIVKADFTDYTTGAGTVKVQTSPDNATWTDLATYTGTTVAILNTTGASYVRFICSAYTSGTIFAGFMDLTASCFANFGYGLGNSEGSQGHLDYTIAAFNKFDGLSQGRGAGQSNGDNMTIVGNNQYALWARNSQWFNNGIQFGLNGTVFNNRLGNFHGFGLSKELAYARDRSSKVMMITKTAISGTITGDTTQQTIFETTDIPNWACGADINFIHIKGRLVFSSGSAKLTATCSLRVQMIGDADAAQGFPTETVDGMGLLVAPINATGFEFDIRVQFRNMSNQVCLFGGFSNASGTVTMNNSSVDTAVVDMQNRVGRVRITAQPTTGDTVAIAFMEVAESWS